MKRALVVLLFAAWNGMRAQTAPPAPMSLTETAARLAANGVATKSARTVMAAAEILRVVERGTPRVHPGGARTGPTGEWAGPLSSEALLRVASTLASETGDWMIAEYAASMMQHPDTQPRAPRSAPPSAPPVTRGATGGPVWADGYLGDKQEATYTIDFDGGSTANLIHVSTGKAAAVFECFLEETGDPRHVLAHARSVASSCSLEWRQPSAGHITLRIRNAGAPVFFVMSSN